MLLGHKIHTWKRHGTSLHLSAPCIAGFDPQADIGVFKRHLNPEKVDKSRNFVIEKHRAQVIDKH
jgi:hypothetical protein